MEESEPHRGGASAHGLSKGARFGSVSKESQPFLSHYLCYKFKGDNDRRLAFSHSSRENKEGQSTSAFFRQTFGKTATILIERTTVSWVFLQLKIFTPDQVWGAVRDIN